MKTIPLSQGKFAIIDDDDFERVNKYKWYAFRHHGTGHYSFYAARNERFISGRQRQRRVCLHHFIMAPPRGYIIDHKNHNGLDNRKENMRICTQAENCLNNRKIRSGFHSPFKGITFRKRNNVWEIRIRFNGKTYYLGSSMNEREAAKKYDKKARELFGDFACLNFPSL